MMMTVVTPVSVVRQGSLPHRQRVQGAHDDDSGNPCVSSTDRCYIIIVSVCTGAGMMMW